MTWKQDLRSAFSEKEYAEKFLEHLEAMKSSSLIDDELYTSLESEYCKIRDDSVERVETTRDLIRNALTGDRSRLCTIELEKDNLEAGFKAGNIDQQTYENRTKPFREDSVQLQNRIEELELLLNSTRSQDLGGALHDVQTRSEGSGFRGDIFWSKGTVIAIIGIILLVTTLVPPLICQFASGTGQLFTGTTACYASVTPGNWMITLVIAGFCLVAALVRTERTAPFVHILLGGVGIVREAGFVDGTVGISNYLSTNYSFGNPGFSDYFPGHDPFMYLGLVGTILIAGGGIIRVRELNIPPFVSMIDDLFGIVLRPGTVFTKVDGYTLRECLGYFAVISVFFAVTTAAIDTIFWGGDTSWGIIMNYCSAWLLLFFNTSILFMLARGFGSRKQFSDTIRMACYSSSPFLIFGWPLLMVLHPVFLFEALWVTGIVWIAVLLLYIKIAITGVLKMQDLTFTRSAAVVVLSILVPAILFVFFFLGKVMDNLGITILTGMP